MPESPFAVPGFATALTANAQQAMLKDPALEVGLELASDERGETARAILPGLCIPSGARWAPGKERVMKHLGVSVLDLLLAVLFLLSPQLAAAAGWDEFKYHVRCWVVSGHPKVEVVGDILPLLPSADYNKIHTMLKRGLDLALAQCPKARSAVGPFIEVSLDLTSASQGKYPGWVEAMFQWDGVTWKGGIYRNDLPLAAMGAEDIRSGATVEGATGTRFSLKKKETLDYRDEKSACYDPVAVLGEVPANVDLGKPAVAYSLMANARRYATERCGKAPERAFEVLLYQSPVSWANWETAWTAKAVYWFGEKNPREYTNKAEQAKQTKLEEQAQAQAQAKVQSGQDVITRTVEGFTLGMAMNEALAKIKAGIRAGTFKGVAAFPGPLTESLPLVSNETTRVDGVDFTTKVSTTFQSPTAAAIQLAFYRDRVSEIRICPQADAPEMVKALRQKYGPPTDTVWGASFPAFTVPEPAKIMGGRQWMDRRTVLVTYPKCSLTISLFFTTGTAAITLAYDDRELVALFGQEIRETIRRREQAEEQRRKTLPRNY